MTHYSAYSNVVSETTSAGYPAALANRHFWYDPSDLATITKDGADIISRFNDKLGNGNDLITGAALWTANTLLFNGTGQYLKTGAIAAMSQPTMIYMIVKQVSWISGDYMFDGNSTSSGMIWQNPTSPGIQAYAGTISPTNNNLAVDTWGIVRVLYSGANSKLIVNNTTPTTWNCGTKDMGGFTLGGKADNSGHWANTQKKDIIAMPSTESEAEIYAWLVTRL